MIVRVWSLVDIEQSIKLPDDLSEKQIVEAILFGTVDDDPIEIEWGPSRRQGEHHETVEIWDDEYGLQLWAKGSE